MNTTHNLKRKLITSTLGAAVAAAAVPAILLFGAGTAQADPSAPTCNPDPADHNPLHSDYMVKNCVANFWADAFHRAESALADAKASVSAKQAAVAEANKEVAFDKGKYTEAPGCPLSSELDSCGKIDLEARAQDKLRGAQADLEDAQGALDRAQKNDDLFTKIAFRAADDRWQALQKCGAACQ